MKQCPICKSMAFDDAVTCFGCLHEFKPEDETAIAESVSAASGATEGAPPAFLIQIKPERELSGQTSWTCKVDLVPA